MRSNIVTELSKNGRIKRHGQFSVLLLLYAHLGCMTRAFLQKKTRYKIEYKRDFVAKKLEISKLHKEESYFLCSFFFVF